jgi:hypothetical protein
MISATYRTGRSSVDRDHLGFHASAIGSAGGASDGEEGNSGRRLTKRKEYGRIIADSAKVRYAVLYIVYRPAHAKAQWIFLPAGTKILSPALLQWDRP